MKTDWKIIGIVGLGIMAASLIMKGGASVQPPIPKYIYNTTVNGFPCKHWSYIDSTPYGIVLNDNESIELNITYNIPLNQSIDIVDIRFHNVCSTSEGHGKIYAYVNGHPSLPTIGFSNVEIPIYIAFPQCPVYGTTFTTIWDTNDVKGSGTYKYTYIYRGSTPLYVKSLELYVANSLCAF